MPVDVAPERVMPEDIGEEIRIYDNLGRSSDCTAGAPRICYFFIRPRQYSFARLFFSLLSIILARESIASIKYLFSPCSVGALFVRVQYAR